MDDLMIIDSFLDEREFRNYIASFLRERGFSNVRIEDSRTADGFLDNDNDLLAEMDGKTYSVQTFLNREITKKEVYETIADTDIENADGGILITNMEVTDEVKGYAAKNNVEVWDKAVLKECL